MTITKKATTRAKAAGHPQPAKKSEPSPGKPATTPPAATTKPPERNLPRTWQEIRVGSVVLAQESADEGWWEASVTAVNTEVLTLRWRDYPTMPAFNRGRTQVGFLAADK